MATRDERDILKIIDEEGKEGECNVVKISKYMGLRLDYIRTILGSMGRRDMIDYKASGNCIIIEKGWRAIGKTPFSKYDGVYKSGPNLSAEEKYEKWATGKISEETRKKFHKEQEAEKRKNKLIRRYEMIPPPERYKMWLEEKV